MHPEVMARLRAEVMEKVGPANRPTYEDIKEMKFLRAVINGAVIRHAILTSTDYKMQKLFDYILLYHSTSEKLSIQRLGHLKTLMRSHIIFRLVPSKESFAFLMNSLTPAQDALLSVHDAPTQGSLGS
jgi:hypothetical protein